MLKRLRDLLEFIRFSHTVFALPFALLAAVLAWRTVPFQWRDLLGILLCMVFARSAAMAFNRIADRHLDALNPRTASRHLPSGKLSLKLAAMFTLLCSVGFIASTALFLPNRWPLLLSVPVLVFLFSYSYAKRFTALCHYWLAAALMLAPIATWLALTGTVAVEAVLIGLAVFFWVGGFDIIYACQDYEFDKQAGLFSLPARLGISKALKAAAFSHALTILFLVALWRQAHLDGVFLAALVLVAVLLFWEHRLVRPDDLSRVNQAFFHVNAVISLGLFAAVIVDLLVQS